MTKSTGIRLHDLSNDKVLLAIHQLKYCTVIDLQKHFGKGKSTLYAIVARLHKKKRIYIADYRRVVSNAPWSAIYGIRLNDETDLQKPPAIPRKEYMKRFDERKKLYTILKAQHGIKKAKSALADRDSVERITATNNRATS